MGTLFVMQKIAFATLIVVSIYILHVTVYYLNKLHFNSRPPNFHLDSEKNLGAEHKVEERKKSVPLENLKSSVQIQLEDSIGFDAAKRTEKVLPHSPHAIAVLVIACNRYTVTRCLKQLLRHRHDPVQFPVIVSQGCDHKQTADAIRAFKHQVHFIRQPDEDEMKVQPPTDEMNFLEYYKIAKHYGWALNQTFNVFKFNTAIVIEDDLDVSPDIFEYFLGTLPLLRADPTLWCVSAWNDNGRLSLVDEAAREALYRTDFFPGLGWMLTRDLWEELQVKWPPAFWDDWMRMPEQRKNRACIRPELSRTYTFGEHGASGGQFYERYLKSIHLNTEFVPFTRINMTFLLKHNYDNQFFQTVNESKVVTHDEFSLGAINHDGAICVLYNGKDEFKLIAEAFGLMKDFKSGVPRTAYMGIVTFYFIRRRVYVAPVKKWSGYDPTWS